MYHYYVIKSLKFGIAISFILIFSCFKINDKPIVFIEFDLIENRLDECLNCGCSIKDELKISKGLSEWWFVYGIINIDEDGTLKSVLSPSHCGKGNFNNIRSEFNHNVGTPYLISNIFIEAESKSDQKVRIRNKIELKKFVTYDKSHNRVNYEIKTIERSFDGSSDGEYIFPLFIPNKNEIEFFGIYEVLLNITTTTIAAKKSSYANTTLISNIPGSRIYIDDALVGWVGEKEPTKIEGVLIGKREIKISDFSGRSIKKELMVEKNKDNKLVLNLLNFDNSAYKTNIIHYIGKNEQGYEEFFRDKDKSIMVKIPQGKFLMGNINENSHHTVFLSDFLIDKTEVSWRQFKNYLKSTNRIFTQIPIWGAQENYAASNILWEEAQNYCEWVGGRLPSEAEWEKAAKGLTSTNYSWGDKWEYGRCNSRDGGPHRPLNIGSFPDCLSPYGVMDMSGNVWEWCNDWFNNKYDTSITENPRGPIVGTDKVLRGGSWSSPSFWLRPTFRYKASPTYRNINYGFRCVYDI